MQPRRAAGLPRRAGRRRGRPLRAETLHESIGQALAATQVRHNLGWVAARRGDVPAALDWYDRVEAEYRAHDVPLALLLMDRCEVLLSARLAAEARANAEAAVAELDAAGLGADLAEARLLAAQAELLAGDTARARATTPTAGRRHAFTRQHRPRPGPRWRAARGGATRAVVEVEARGRRAPTARRRGAAATRARPARCGTRRRARSRRRWPRRSGRSGRSRPPGGASRRSTRG